MPTLREAMTSFLQIDRSPATNRNYRRILTRLILAIGPERDITLVRPSDLTDYFHRLLHHRRLKRSTLVAYCQVIRTFFFWCYEEGYIPRSPARSLIVRNVPASPSTRRGIPPADLKRMIECARWTNARDYALILFILDTACRAGGAASLTLDNLHLDSYSASLLEKGGEWVQVFYGEQTAEALRAWLTVRPACKHNRVFTLVKGDPRPLSERSISEAITRLAIKAGAYRADGKPYKAHALRHSTAEALVKQGVQPYVVQRKLNHASLTTTLDNYYPKGDDYVAQISRLHALAALEDAEEADEPANIIPFKPKTGSV